MTNTKLFESFMYEIKNLKECGDCVGVKVNDDFGFFIMLENDEEEKIYYFIEPSTIDEDGCYEPCDEPYCIQKENIKEVEEFFSEYLF